MVEFLQSYGIWIFFGFLFLLMMRGQGHGGMGCGMGGHHGEEQEGKAEQQDAHDERSSTGCH